MKNKTDFEYFGEVNGRTIFRQTIISDRQGALDQIKKENQMKGLMEYLNNNSIEVPDFLKSKSKDG